MTTLYVRGTVDQVRATLYGLPALLSGAPGGRDVARGLLLRLGVTALSLCKVRFETLSRGGTYEGEKWAPLAPSTIAGRRRPKGVPTRYQARRGVAEAALKLQKARRGSKAQQKALKAYERSKKKAAQAFAPLQILVDTGVLRASLSPGLEGPSGDANQVFKLESGAVIVGTKLFYARFHQYGTRRMPARPPLPEKFPPAWHQPLGEAARTGVVRAIEVLLNGRTTN
jgi:phage gpG-like protein